MPSFENGLVTIIVALTVANTFSLIVLLLHHGISTAARVRRAAAVKHWRAVLDLAIGLKKEINPRRKKAMEMEIIGEILREKLVVLTSQKRTRIIKLFEQAGLTHFYRRRLKSLLWWRRGDAVMALSEARQTHLVDDIAKLLDDRFMSVRLAAAAGLATLGDEKSIDSLLCYLNQLGHVGVHWLQDIFVMLLTDKPEAANKLLSKKLPIIMEKAIIETVGHMHISPASPALIEVAQDEERDQELRISAVRALGNLGKHKHIAGSALNSPNWEVRAAAAVALGKSKAAKYISRLEKALSDESWWVRVNSANALAGMGNQGQAALHRALESSDAFAKDIARQTLDELAFPDYKGEVTIA